MLGTLVLTALAFFAIGWFTCAVFSISPDRDPRPFDSTERT